MSELHLVTGKGGKEHISSADHGSFNAAIFGEGSYVLNRGNKFAASVVAGNKVEILDGDLLFNGRHVRLNRNQKIELQIAEGENGMYRNDLIVVRYTRDSQNIEKCEFVVIKGTASTSSNPPVPEYNSGSIIEDVSIAEMPLYKVSLNGINIINNELIPMFEEASLVPDGSVGTSKLANKSVTAAKIAKNAIVPGTFSFSLAVGDWILNDYGVYEQTKTMTGVSYAPDTHFGLLGLTRGISHYPGNGNSTWGWSQTYLKNDEKKLACLYSAKMIAENTVKFVATKIPDGTLYVSILFVKR